MKTTLGLLIIAGLITLTCCAEKPGTPTKEPPPTTGPDISQKSDESLRKLKEQYTDQLQKAADDPKESARWLGGLFALSSNMYINGMKDEAAALRKETVDKSIELVKKFPESAEAHRNLAFELTYRNIDSSQDVTAAAMEAGMHEYVACLKIDKKAARCRRPYETLVKSYTQPRCAEGQIKDELAAYIGSEKEEAPFTKKMEFEGKDYFVEPSPVLTSKNVAKLTQGMDEAYHEPFLSLDLDPQGAAKWSEASEKNIGRFAVIALKDKVLTAPLIREKIAFGRLRLTLGTAEKKGSAEKLFKQLCGKIEKPKLPKDLKI